MTQTVEAYIPYPEAKIFGNNGQPRSVQDIGTIAQYEFDHAEYPDDGPILLYKKGLLFPTKGFVFPQAIQCINVAKRLFQDTIFLLTDKRLWGLYLGIALLPFKAKVSLLNRIIKVYNTSMLQVVKPIAPLKKHHIDVSRELWTIIETFLKSIGIEDKVAEDFALIFATCINYDNAYHFRIIDLFSEMNKEKLLKNPAAELSRCLEIYRQRESGEFLFSKIKILYWLLRIGFLSKRIKKAFLTAVSAANFSKLQYDRIDRYNVLDRGDYLFMGLTWEQRQEIFYFLHKGNLPPALKLNQ